MEFQFNPPFYREQLGTKHDHEKLVREFEATRPEGEGLKNYLQERAFIDEDTGIIRTYLIRQRVTGELVGYYSIRAGDILLTRDGWKSAISGIELTNFAVNGAYRRHHPKIAILGRRIFFDFVYPQVKEIHQMLGTAILYIYALDEEPLKITTNPLDSKIYPKKTKSLYIVVVSHLTMAHASLCICFSDEHITFFLPCRASRI